MAGITDEDGVVLESTHATENHEDNPDACVGVGLSWAGAGLRPNGPMQALSTGESAVVRKNEICQAMRDAATIGCPIRDQNGRTMAVICAVTTHDSAGCAHSLSELAATAVEQGLALERQKSLVAQSTRAEVAATLLKSYPSEATISSDDATLASLSRAARALTSTASLNDVCHALLSEIRDFIPEAAVSIFEMDPDIGKLLVRANAGLDDETVQQLWGAPNKGIVGRVFASRETMACDDLWNDPRVSPHVARPANLRSLIALPLKYRDECLGVLAVYSMRPGLCEQGAGRASGLLALLETFAAQATLAVLSARPLSHLNWMSHKLGLLQETGMALQSTLQLEELVGEVIRSSTVVLDAKWSLFLGLEEKNGEVTFGQPRYMGSSGPREPHLLETLFMSPGHLHGLHGLLQSENVLRMDDLSRHSPERVDKRVSGRAMAGCLRRRDREPLGILAVWRPSEEPPFSELDEHLFISLIVQAGLAFEKNDLLAKATMESEKLKTVFNALVDGVIVFDPAGFVVQINQAGAAHLGSRAEDLVGRGYSDLMGGLGSITDEKHNRLSPEDLPGAKALRGSSNESRIAIETSNGERYWLLAHGSPLFESGATEPRGAVLVWHDITLEVEAGELQRNLLQVATHELRNPISVLEAYLALLSDDRYRAKPGKTEEGLAMLKHNVARIRRMVDSFYNLLRIGTGQMAWNPKPGRFSSLLEMLLPELNVLANKKGISLEVAVAGDRGGHWDHSMLEQVLLNLIGNAVKFTSQGGKISIGSEEEGEFLHVSVKDTGVGIPAPHVTEVFRQFFRVPEHVMRFNPEGSGLGLSITKAIIEQHGGTIWIESEGEGKGTTVHFTLPLGKPK